MCKSLILLDILPGWYMARGLSSAVKTELATGNIDPVLLIEFGFGTPIY